MIIACTIPYKLFSNPSRGFMRVLLEDYHRMLQLRINSGSLFILIKKDVIHWLINFLVFLFNYVAIDASKIWTDN